MTRLLLFSGSILVFGVAALVAEPKPKPPTTPRTPARNEVNIADGEQRYRANCSRCHQAPPKFSPRAMGTVIRHMRVRAMITDDDMHAILQFLTQ